MHLTESRFTRNIILNEHTPQVMKNMLPGAILILDGTYVHIQKSSDFRLQKRTWCTYKMDNIVKMMVAITGDGHCFMAYGPYLSDSANSDMYILNMLCDPNVEHNESSPLVDTFIPGMCEDLFKWSKGFCSITFCLLSQVQTNF